jgi:hypothetical protein
MPNTSSRPTRAQLTDLWRSKLKQAYIQHCCKIAEWREALEAQRQSKLPNLDAIKETARAEALARVEYVRVLRIYMELVLKRKKPPAE